MWDSFQDNLENTINTNIPQKTARSKDGNHWIKEDIKWLIRKRDKHNKRKKKSADTKHNSKYKELKRLQIQSAFSDKINFTNTESKDRCNMTDQPYPTIPDQNITENGIIKLLSNLNPYKADGPDSITSRVLKKLSSDIAPILTNIFRWSYEAGNYQIFGKE
ncbi:unnamed protein product [Mytilus edulis]|uniref:Uncharacterized protein n=1 Tax=Mytilus edulis TaxID=6550 RepID=A0A8S3TUY2_MYTED|nr:unnamed protein product [Mytilus edulis]